MGTTSSNSTPSSAGCHYNAGISLRSAHTGTIEGPLVYTIIARFDCILKRLIEMRHYYQGHKDIEEQDSPFKT